MKSLAELGLGELPELVETAGIWCMWGACSKCLLDGLPCYGELDDKLVAAVLIKVLERNEKSG